MARSEWIELTDWLRVLKYDKWVCCSCFYLYWWQTERQPAFPRMLFSLLLAMRLECRGDQINTLMWPVSCWFVFSASCSDWVNMNHIDFFPVVTMRISMKQPAIRGSALLFFVVSARCEWLYESPAKTNKGKQHFRVGQIWNRWKETENYRYIIW